MLCVMQYRQTRMPCESAAVASASVLAPLLYTDFRQPLIFPKFFPNPPAATALVLLPASASSRAGFKGATWPARAPQVLGLDFCGTRECPSLLVATDTFIGRWLLLGLHWAPASHYRYPPRFKQATVRAGAHTPPSPPSSPTSLTMSAPFPAPPLLPR